MEESKCEVGDQCRAGKYTNNVVLWGTGGKFIFKIWGRILV
jgi:hypothetical protein